MNSKRHPSELFFGIATGLVALFNPATVFEVRYLFYMPSLRHDPSLFAGISRGLVYVVAFTASCFDDDRCPHGKKIDTASKIRHKDAKTLSHKFHSCFVCAFVSLWLGFHRLVVNAPKAGQVQETLL